MPKFNPVVVSMTLLGPGVTAAMTPKITNEINNSVSIEELRVKSHTDAWIGLSVQNSQARVKFAEVLRIAIRFFDRSG